MFPARVGGEKWKQWKRKKKVILMQNKSIINRKEII